MLISGSTGTHPSARPYHRRSAQGPARHVPRRRFRQRCYHSGASRRGRRRRASGGWPGPTQERPRAGRWSCRFHGARRALAASAGGLRAIARSAGPVRVLVGARRHADVGPLAARLERLGAHPESFRLSGVLAATAPSGRALARALGSDPRVAYVERDRQLRVAVDPFDSVDLTPGGSGIKYTWAYDEVGAAAALAAVRRRLPAHDRRGGHGRGRDPPGAGGQGRAYLRPLLGWPDGHRPGRARHLRGRSHRCRGRQRDRRQGRGGQHQILAIRASRDGNVTVSAIVARHRGGDRSRRVGDQHEPLRPGHHHQPATGAPDRLLQRRSPRGGVGQRRSAREPARVPRRGGGRLAWRTRRSASPSRPRARAGAAPRSPTTTTT